MGKDVRAGARGRMALEDEMNGDTDEGGVAAGFSVLGSLLLVDVE